MKKQIITLLSAATGFTALAQTRSSWALLEGPNGQTWSVTTVAQMQDLGNEYFTDLRYGKVQITIQDASHQTIGSFTADLTSLKANSIEVYGPITNHLFNADDQCELGLDIHVPGNASNHYQSQIFTQIYSADGTCLSSMEGSGLIIANGDESRFVLSRTIPSGQWGQTALDVYRPSAEGLQLAHTWTYDNINAEYMSSSTLTTTLMSDGLHYLLAYYEKPLPQLDRNGDVRYDPVTWLPYWTANNHFIVQHFNADFEKVDELTIPTDCPQGFVCRMMGIGSASDRDVTQGYFTADDRYNYLILCEDTDQNWSDTYTFEVYAQGNEYVGQFCSGVHSFWNRLSSIEGEPEQWIFLQSDASTGEQQLALVDPATFTCTAVIPSLLDGKMISANIDRCADEAEGYKYVIGINEPEIDMEGNVIAQYGIYHRDLTTDRYVQFNMGPMAETFTPFINSQSLDPHLFVTDDQHEFIFLAKVLADDGMLYSTLFIGNEEGEIIQTYTGEGTTKGDIRNAAILNYGTEHPELFISYYDWENELYTNEFIPLPLDRQSGIRQVITHSDACSFNLMGQRTTTHAPGLYISRGTKIMKK